MEPNFRAHHFIILNTFCVVTYCNILQKVSFCFYVWNCKLRLNIVPYHYILWLFKMLFLWVLTFWRPRLQFKWAEHSVFLKTVILSERVGVI